MVPGTFSGTADDLTLHGGLLGGPKMFFVQKGNELPFNPLEGFKALEAAPRAAPKLQRTNATRFSGPRM